MKKLFGVLILAIGLFTLAGCKTTIIPTTETPTGTVTETNPTENPTTVTEEPITEAPTTVTEEPTTETPTTEIPTTEETKYVISFESNGGSAVEDIEGVLDAEIEAPSDPEKDYYVFSGWYSDSELSSLISWPYTIEGDATFYAAWTNPTTEVHSVVEVDNYNDYSKGTDLSTSLSLDNHIFSVESNSVNNGHGGICINIRKDGQIRLYKNYGHGGNALVIAIKNGSIISAEITYTFAYGGNGNRSVSINGTEYTLTEGGTYTYSNLNANALRIENTNTSTNLAITGIKLTYNLGVQAENHVSGEAEWFTPYQITWISGATTIKTETSLSLGDVPSYSGDVPTQESDHYYSYTFVSWSFSPALDENNGISGDTVATAQFSASAIYHSVVWKNCDGTTLLSENNYKYGDTASYLNTPSYEEDGYTYNFIGWSTEEGSNSTTENFVIADKDETYYAVYEKALVEYTITYLSLGEGGSAGLNPITYTIESETIELTAPLKNGYNGSWEEGSSIPKGSTGDKSFTASYTAIEYTISYNLNDGTNDNSNPLTYTIEDSLTLASPSKTGYTGSWDNSGKIDAGTTGNLTFNASYSAIEYTITYNLNDGQNDGLNPATYTIESGEIQLLSPSKTGYNGSWDNDGKIEAGSTGDKTFTASYSAIEYQITYVLNGGDNNASNPEKYTIEDGEIILSSPSKNGYTFKGWVEGSSIPANSTEDISFTASWEATEYTITYELNYGSNDVSNPTKYTIESDLITLASPTKNGYTGSWNNNGTIAAGSTGNLTFTASYSAIEYTITYELGEGSNNPSNPTKYTIESDLITLASPTKTGYTGSWNNNGTIVAGSTGNVIFTAYYSAVEYDVVYNLDGGTNNASNPLTYTIENGKIVLSNPTKDDFNFAGWYSDSSFLNQVTEISSGSHGNKTLYARWTDLETYSITFHTPDGSTKVLQTTQDTGFSPSGIDKDGYLIDSYYSESEHTNAITFPYTFTADSDVYVVWHAIEYTISYILNDGSNDVSNPQTYTVEDEISLVSPTKNGYNGSWKEGSSIALGSTGDKTFTASYIAIEYTITYELNYGSNNPVNPTKYTVEDEVNLVTPTKNGYNGSWNNGGKIEIGTTGNLTFTASYSAIEYTITYELGDGSNNPSNPTKYTIESDLISLLAPTKTGYTGSWNNGGAIVAGSTGNITFTASYSAIEYTITYELNYGSNDPLNPTKYTVEDEVNLLAPTKNGYNGSWNNGGKIEVGTTGNITFTASYSAIEYTITYELNYGSNNPSNPTKYTIESDLITLVAPTKTGYTGSWNNNGTIAAGSTGNVTFTASYSTIEYTITYELGDGLNDASNPTKYTIESDLITLVSPTKTGYTGSWNNNGTIAAGSTGNVTFTASYSVTDYTITYNLDGGTNNDSNPAKYNIESGEITLLDPTKDGYTFDGWYSDSEFSNQVTKISSGSHGNKTLYAQWTENGTEGYIITYYDCGDTDEVAFSGTHGDSYPTSHTYGSATTLVNPTKSHYLFLGWYTSYSGGSKVTSLGAEDYTSNIKLYAQWMAVPSIYDVYGAGGNSGAIYNRDYFILKNETTENISLMAGDYEFVLAYASSTDASKYASYLVFDYQLTLAPGEYLVIVGSKGSNGIDLPFNFYIESTLAAGSTAGKVGLLYLETSSVSSTLIKAMVAGTSDEVCYLPYSSTSTTVSYVGALTGTASSDFVWYSSSELTDAQKVIFDTQFLSACDDEDNVTANLSLETESTNGCTISWSSSNTDVLSNTGTVVRPASSSTDASVTLTATITCGEVSMTKVFELTVKRLPTDAELIADAKTELPTSLDQAALQATSTTALITESTNGLSIVWSAVFASGSGTGSSITFSNGVATVTLPSGDTATYTITATITSGEASDTQTYSVTLSPAGTVEPSVLAQSDFGEYNNTSSYAEKTDVSVNNGTLDPNPDGYSSWYTIGGNTNGTSTSAWDWMRFGVKSVAAVLSDTPNDCIKTNFKISGVTKVVVNIVAAAANTTIYLQTSTDGSTWTTAASQTIASKIAQESTGESTNITFDNLELSGATYFRIVFVNSTPTSSNGWLLSLKTVTFYGFSE